MFLADVEPSSTTVIFVQWPEQYVQDHLKKMAHLSLNLLLLCPSAQSQPLSLSLSLSLLPLLHPSLTPLYPASVIIAAQPLCLLQQTPVLNEFLFSTNPCSQASSASVPARPGCP